ncbi:MAG: glycosyltransferase [Pseudomonadota bacterium]
MDVREARNSSRGLARYAEALSVLLRLNKDFKPDVYVLGFRGHEIYWPVRWLTRGKPLVFDALMSPSAALREENKAGWIGQILAPIMRWMEGGILRNADLVLTDTSAHIDLYVEQFKLPREKLLAIPVGALETVHASDQDGQLLLQDVFSVLFYGSMLPLHGIETIIAAAASLTDLPIRFDFIGGSPRQAKQLHRLCRQYGVTQYTYRRWVPLDDLVTQDLPRSDLCLGGPFGGTPQARRVVTSKTSQALALGKATVVGATDADLGFVERENCLLVEQADPNALAQTLRWAFSHRAVLPQIGERGRQLYRRRLSVEAIAQQLCPALRTLQRRD